MAIFRKQPRENQGGREKKKRSRPKLGLSLSLKLGLLYAVFFVMSSLVLFGAAYYIIDGMLEAGEREILKARIQEYRAWFAEGGINSLKNRFYSESSVNRDVFFVRIVSPRNNVLFVSAPPGAEPFDFSQISTAGEPGSDSWWSIIRGEEQKARWTVASTRLGRGLILQVGKSSEQSQQLRQYLRWVFLVFVVPVILLGVLGGGLATFRAMAPLRRVIETVEDIIGTGKTDKRVPGRAEKGEMGRLVSLLNTMLEKNDALITAMHQSLDNVAHDLRTPMTRLRGMAEMALSHPDDHQAGIEALADSMEESDRVLTMLNTLMDVAEAETGVMRLSRGPVSLPVLVRRVMDLYEIVAEDKGVSLTAELPERLQIQADLNRIQQVVANLVDNAIKYSSPGGKVWIKAQEEDGWAVLFVGDEGPGIEPAERERIWDRLYRGDQSRSQRGLGLGLSFVRAIVQAHGGQVHLESVPGQGSVFIISLKADPGEEEQERAE